jgi:hypothetical protein
VLKLTSYEWTERLQDLLCNHKEMIHFTVLCTLAHLWRCVDGELFEASPENDLRQDALEKACLTMGYAPEGISSLVKEQRARERRELRDTLPG